MSFSLAFRCRMHTSFCCRGVRYCSGVGGLMPWLSLHSMYFKERLQGDACHQEGRRKEQQLEASLALLVLPPPEGSRSGLPDQGPWELENTQPFSGRWWALSEFF